MSAQPRASREHPPADPPGPGGSAELPPSGSRALDVDLLPDITSDEGVESFSDSHYTDQVPPHH